MNILEAYVYLAPFEEALFLSVLNGQKIFGEGDICGVSKRTYEKMASSSSPYKVMNCTPELDKWVSIKRFGVPVYALKFSDNIILQKRINEYRKPLKEKLYLYLNFL